MSKHEKGTKGYAKSMATYLKTKERSAFAYHILSQLIPSFTVDHKGFIREVEIDDTKPIVIDFE